MYYHHYFVLSHIHILNEQRTLGERIETCDIDLMKTKTFLQLLLVLNQQK
jgi:hypothetical protein